MRGKLFALTAVVVCLQAALYGQKLQTGHFSAAALKGLPIAFEENRGQVDPVVRVLAHIGNNAIFFTPSEAVLAVYDQDAQKHPTISAVRMKWIGANANPKMQLENALPGVVNYLIGQDPARWHTNLPTYARVRYRNLFPGVDAVFYGRDGEIEYDLIVAPGVDLRKIRFAFEEALSMRVAKNGDLVLTLKNAEVRQHLPHVYQKIGGKRRALAASYVTHPDKTVGYHVSGVDHQRALVIDPTLSYSTYLGGSGSDFVSGVAVDQFGRAYVTGTTAFGFPTKNPAQGNQVGFDAFVTKLWATGGGLIYSTYLGGSSSAERGVAIGVDRFGNAYVVGNTKSTDFPVTSGAFQSTNRGGRDTFITKLSPSGSNFVYSTLLGGAAEDSMAAMALDTQHRVYVTGFTCSPDFPVQNAFQPTLATECGSTGASDAFVARLSATGTDVDYSTFLGGDFPDSGSGIAVDSTFHAYVAGLAGPGFPTTQGAFQRTLRGGGGDAFVTKFSANGSSLVFSTLLGGSAGDGANAIAVDSFSRAYVTGATDSADFPVTPGAFQQTSHSSDATGFVTKLQQTGAGLIYSTYLGGSQFGFPDSIAVDSLGQAHVVGTTQSADFPLRNPIQHFGGGGSDGFASKLSASGKSLIYSTYIGGSAGDGALSVRLDSANNAYIGGGTASKDFPTTPGAFDRTLNNISDGWVMKIKP